jgi:GrpB-like predicted nucleotidyltransferase (UPF0157 family)
MVDPHSDPVQLVPSQYERWRDAFAAERERVEAALARRDLDEAVERVAHVGSTAVPDLAAKDVIDLDVVVADGAVPAVADALVEELGGTLMENSDEWRPVFREHEGQRFNDHVFAASSERWRISVATRAVLRERPDLRRAYERRKRELADEHDELTPYSRGKTDVIRRVLEAAREDEAVDLFFEVPRLE